MHATHAVLLVALWYSGMTTDEGLENQPKDEPPADGVNFKDEMKQE